MNKELKKKKFDIIDYRIRIWNGTFFIGNESSLDCILERTTDGELICFGIQTNLMNDGKDEKVIKLCMEVETKMKELDDYLKGNLKYE